jgi:hypothetical protein
VTAIIRRFAQRRGLSATGSARTRQRRGPPRKELETRSRYPKRSDEQPSLNANDLVARAQRCKQETDHSADQNAGCEGCSRVPGDVVVCHSGVAPHLGGGALAALAQGGNGRFESLSQIVNLWAVFVVQSGQQFFDIVDQLLEFAGRFQEQVLPFLAISESLRLSLPTV